MFEALRRRLTRSSDFEAQLAEAEERLRTLVARDTESQAAELERTLALARAKSLSRLVEEERRIAEDRRAAVQDRERQAGAELSETLAKEQSRMGHRLAEWTADLERTEQAFDAQLATLRERQEQLLSEATSRLALDTERLDAASEQQRERLAALVAEFDGAARETADTARVQLEAHESERRRALHEVAERLRERERV